VKAVAVPTVNANAASPMSSQQTERIRASLEL
jgi:hypothetical protein